MTQLSSPTANAASPALPEAAAPGRLADFLTLTKPRITLLVVITAFIGFAMGVMPLQVGWPWLTLAATLVGTGLSCMGASAFNQVYERDTDALMTRTSDRPLPAGRMGVTEAMVTAVVLSVLGVGTLAVFANPLAAGLSAFTIFSYALMYTPMKRWTPWSLWVGAVPGAMPPVIGFAAATGSIGLAAVLLFLVMFIWQIPHFLAIAWLYREQYARAGFPMLPVREPDGRSTFSQIVASSMVLLAVGVLPTLAGVTGLVYFNVALACGMLFFGCALDLALQPTKARARRVFFASLVYLPIVLGAMPLDQMG